MCNCCFVTPLGCTPPVSGPHPSIPGSSFTSSLVPPLRITGSTPPSLVQPHPSFLLPHPALVRPPPHILQASTHSGSTPLHPWAHPPIPGFTLTHLYPTLPRPPVLGSTAPAALQTWCTAYHRAAWAAGLPFRAISVLKLDNWTQSAPNLEIAGLSPAAAI